MQSINPVLCDFADRVLVGNQIVTNNGRQVKCIDDLRAGSDETRRHRIVPVAASAIEEEPAIECTAPSLASSAVAVSADLRAGSDGRNQLGIILVVASASQSSSCRRRTEARLKSSVAKLARTN